METFLWEHIVSIQLHQKVEGSVCLCGQFCLFCCLRCLLADFHVNEDKLYTAACVVFMDKSKNINTGYIIVIKQFYVKQYSQEPPLFRDFVIDGEAFNTFKI